MKNHSVIAVVVTYNRRELLMECIDAIMRQTLQVARIIVIDNASTDGTEDELKRRGYIDRKQMEYIRMSENLGGAGGFYEGMKVAKEYCCDWIWLMDDDTIATETCLENLIQGADVVDSKDSNVGSSGIRNTAFIASAVYGPNGEFMNVPVLSQRRASNGYCYWYSFLDQSLVNIESATFVSILIKHDAVVNCGLPCKEYFIWGDDSEYTLRLTKYYGEGYLAGKSKAIHKRTNCKALVINNETDCSRMKLFYYKSRNENVNTQYYSISRPKIRAIKNILDTFLLLKQKHGLRKFWACFCGNLVGIVRYKHFRDYIDGQIKGQS